MAAASAAADLVVRNARIWTGDPKNPWADSLAVTRDIITAVGNVKEDGARVIDAQGRLITPGFIDSHVHLVEGGMRLNSVQLRDAKTKKEFIDRIAAFAKTVPPGTWILGGDWDHQNWGGELPSRHWIDAVTPQHPVWLHRLDGHMALANSLALKKAELDRDTRDVSGGAIVRDAKGELTGLLKDNAMEVMAEAVPLPDDVALRKALDAAIAHLNRFGITSVHNVGPLGIEVIRAVQHTGGIPLRIYQARPLAEWRPLFDFIDANGRGDRWLKMGLVKIFFDGSLGSHTAAFEKPYTDAPSDNGLLLLTPESVYDSLFAIYPNGLQPAIHAIGDRANHQLLDVVERASKVLGPRLTRVRVEHAQHLLREDIARFAKFQLIASMQPYHLIDDGRWAEKVIGAERAKTSWAMKSLLDAGVTLAFGSDWFVAPPNPMEGIYAAVTRQTLDGKHPGGWTPSERISVEQALRAYTQGGAYASMDENDKGVIAVGKLADFAMLDQDITKIAPEKIRNAKVLLTVVGGKPVFEHKSE